MSTEISLHGRQQRGRRCGRERFTVTMAIPPEATTGSAGPTRTPPCEAQK